jgi:hypothetical protein
LPKNRKVCWWKKQLTLKPWTLPSRNKTWRALVLEVCLTECTKVYHFCRSLFQQTYQSTIELIRHKHSRWTPLIEEWEYQRARTSTCTKNLLNRNKIKEFFVNLSSGSMCRRSQSRLTKDSKLLYKDISKTCKLFAKRNQQLNTNIRLWVMLAVSPLNHYFEGNQNKVVHLILLLTSLDQRIKGFLGHCLLWMKHL